MKSPSTLSKVSLALALLTAATPAAFAQHPNPQPMMMMPTQTTSADGSTTYVVTAEGPMPLTGNQLPYVESNMFDSNGVEMLNTLPSRPGAPFNLHDGPVLTSDIDKTSPKDDLLQTLIGIQDAARKGTVDLQKIQFGLDILEGNPIPNKVYSGFALLHYTGPEKVKKVGPILDSLGNVVGGNVNIHQIWYDNHIESDTSLLDVSAVRNVPFTVTYTIDVLSGGADDFSPFVMYFDAPNPMITGMLPPHVAMDATFYPLADGKRFTVRLKHAQGRYYNLTYTWGWRNHPPRVQVTENANKRASEGPGIPSKTLLEWETSTFGTAPRSSEAAKLAAIAKIGELAPAKRMWQALRDARGSTPAQVVGLIADALVSFNDWSDRTHLPRGVQADPTADATLFFVNNTIYGNVKTFNNWNGPGSVYKVALLNGDHFLHGYFNVDFGGARGWENQFESAGGAGASHTFGRCHWMLNAGSPLGDGAINVPVASADGQTPGRHRVEITLNFNSPERLKLYQFDPYHHDVAVYSLH